MNQNHTCIWMHMNSCMFSRNFWHKTRWVHVLMPEIKLMWLMCSCLTGEWFVIYEFSVSSQRPNGISCEDLLELSIFLQKSSSSFEAEDLDSASVWHYAHYETWSDEDEKWKNACCDRPGYFSVYVWSSITTCRNSKIFKEKQLTQLCPVKENTSCMVCHKCSPKSLQVQALCFVEILSKTASYTQTASYTPRTGFALCGDISQVVS